MSMRLALGVLLATFGTILSARIWADDTQPSTQSAERGIVVLRANGTADFQHEPFPLERELYRQALLIAARDQMGLDTRDEELGESFPADWQDPDPRGVAVVVYRQQDGTLVVNCIGIGFIRAKSATRPIASPLAHIVKVTTVVSYWPDIGPMIVQAEKWSRTEFPDWLRREHFAPCTIPSAGDDQPSKDVEDRLQDFSIISQFEAVRLAHQAIREQGESPAWVGVLVRGYANLGQLTRFHWTSASKIFVARSLLYSQRLLAADANSPLALRLAAYANAMAGFHAAALDDLNHVPPDAPPAPDWANLVEPLCKYDTVKLMEFATANSDSKQLAMYMAFLTVENCGSPAAVIETGKVALQAIPVCDRIIDAIVDNSGVSYGHAYTTLGLQSSIDALRLGLPQITELPPVVTDTWQRAHNNPDLMQDVADVSQAFAGIQDGPDPSWSMLGHLLQETNFIHTYRRVYFEQNFWGVDPSDTIAKTHALVQGHPKAALISVIAPQQGALSADKLNAIDLGDISYRVEGNMSPTLLLQTAGRSINDVWGMETLHSDPCAWDQEIGMVAGNGRNFVDATGAQSSELLRKVSPYSPVGVAGMIKYDWTDVTPDQLARWQTDFRGQPAFDYAAAQHYLNAGQKQSALPYLQDLVKISPDRKTYEELANCYLDAGDEATWLATMKEALQQEDYALDHATENVDIAVHFVAKGQYLTALPYADAAADSGAAWALEYDAHCHTAVGDYATADKLLSDDADRYGNPVYWYMWCRATGRGNLVGAKQAMQSWVNAGSDAVGIAGYYCAEGKPDQATLFLKARFESVGDPLDAAWAAILYDAAGDTASRDDLLMQASVKGKAYVANNGNDESYEFVSLLRSSITMHGGQLDGAAIDRDYNWAPPERRAPLDYLAGLYLMNHGDKQQALELMKNAAFNTTDRSVTGYLARIELHDQGIDPYRLEAAEAATRASQ
ncbi:MAG: hypothetical protein ABSG31_09795 [Tepidisphaeraceae bacterium]